MVSLMQRRREMMGASTPAPDPGVEYYSFGNIIIKNNKSATISVAVIAYASNITFYPNPASNITAGNTSTRGAVTDGTYIWINAGSCTTVTYNGSTATFKRSGDYFRIKIPDNFDPTIPFAFS